MLNFDALRCLYERCCNFSYACDASHPPTYYSVLPQQEPQRARARARAKSFNCGVTYNESLTELQQLLLVQNSSMLFRRPVRRPAELLFPGMPKLSTGQQSQSASPDPSTVLLASNRMHRSHECQPQPPPKASITARGMPAASTRLAHAGNELRQGLCSTCPYGCTPMQALQEPTPCLTVPIMP